MSANDTATPLMPFRDRTFYKGLAHRVGILVLGVVLSACFGSAQLVPPTTAIRWDNQADGDWEMASNWMPASVPDSGADVLFGSISGGPANPEEPAITVSNDNARSLRSLWIDAASGIFYTIGGTGTLTLGGGLPDGDYLIAVTPSWHTQTKNNINNAIVLDDSVLGRTRWIVNNSQGGLRFSETVNIGSQNLTISGFGATHFNESLSGTGDVSTVNAFAYSLPHLILQANNSGWSGALNVGVKTVVIVKANGALGTGTNTVVAGSNPLAGGGTLAFRSHVGSTLDYTAPAQTIQVSGAGAVRAVGRPGVGAIYHDGGNNTFAGGITLPEPPISVHAATWAASRSWGRFLDQGFFTKSGRGSSRLLIPNLRPLGFPLMAVCCALPIRRISPQQ